MAFLSGRNPPAPFRQGGAGAQQVTREQGGGATLVRRDDQAPGSGAGGIYYDPYTGRIGQRGVTTPGLYRDTRAGSLKISTFGIIGATAANGGWRLVQVDRPMVTIPVDILDSPLLYAPGEIPLNEQACFRSFGHGVCYLWAPGDWYIRAQDTLPYQVMLVDASDPALVAFLVQNGGANGQTNSATTVLAASSTSIAAANRWRRSIVVQCIDATYGIYIKVSGTANRVSGQYLAPGGGSITFEGNSLTLEAINAISEDGAIDSLASVLEFY